MKILAIDPGSTESGWCVWDGINIIDKGKTENIKMLTLSSIIGSCARIDVCVIEMVASYGMPVGEFVFDTCVWIGRFMEAAKNYGIMNIDLMKRIKVKMHLCHSSRAKDSNVTQALVDRFAYGQKNKGKGTKKANGFFYGFKSDIWQAFALNVTYYDLYSRSFEENKKART